MRRGSSGGRSGRMRDEGRRRVPNAAMRGEGGRRQWGEETRGQVKGGRKGTSARDAKRHARKKLGRGR